MTWIWISLLAWLALSPAVALFVGRAVAIADRHRAETVTGPAATVTGP